MINTTTLGTRWTSSVKYVDIDTGEEITKREARINYIIIKTTKYATLNKLKTKGHTQFTRECKRNPQGKLFNN